MDKADINIYLTTKKRLSPGTITTRMSRINVFLTWLEDRQITSSTIEQFLYFLHEKGMRNTSINTYIFALTSLRDYMIDRGLSDDFMKGFKRYKEEEVFIDPLTEDECSILLQVSKEYTIDTLRETYFSLTSFLLFTGSRFEDGQALQVKSVDLIGKRITYMQLKTKRVRHIFLPESLLCLIRSQIRGKMHDELVFTNSKGGRIHYPDYHHYLKKIATQAGITKRVSPHVLRHSYSQVFYDATGDINLLKDVLGHREITSTLRYVTNSQKRIKDAQLLHPFFKKETNPNVLIKQIEEAIENKHLEEDERFDQQRLRELVSSFLNGLHTCVRSHSLSQEILQR